MALAGRAEGVLDPGDEAAAVPVPDPGCDSARAEFAIYSYGDLDAEPIRFETEPALALLAAVPIDETRPHILVEQLTGLEVRFEDEAIAVTMIEVTNPEEEDVGWRLVAGGAAGAEWRWSQYTGLPHRLLAARSMTGNHHGTLSTPQQRPRLRSSLPSHHLAVFD